MKIFGPVRKAEDVKPLAEAGVDEFYCGVVFEPWKQRFGREIELNRRSFCEEAANFASIKELQQAIDIADSHEKPIYLAVNHHFFNEIQLPYIFDLINTFRNIGGTGIIASDLDVIEFSKANDLEVVISTDLNVYNAETIEFLVKYQIDRIVLPRDITLDDVKALREKFPELELEAFMLNGPCKFSDSLCLPIHSTKWGAFCRFLSQTDFTFYKNNGECLTFEENHRLQQNRFYYETFFFRKACGICSIWRLLSHRIDSCKLVGRVLPVERVAEEAKLIKQNIDIAHRCQTEEEFLSQMINPFDGENQATCTWNYQCYFPEVRMNKHDESI